MMSCDRCGNTDHPPKAKFCKICGKQLGERKEAVDMEHLINRMDSVMKELELIHNRSADLLEEAESIKTEMQRYNEKNDQLAG